MNKQNGIKRLISAWGYSISGLKLCWLNEASFRQELLLVIVLLPLSFWLTHDTVERILLIVPLFLILIVEVLNSAIEACIDRMGEELHPLAKQAKDMGSAAVWLTFLLTLIIWLLVLV